MTVGSSLGAPIPSDSDKPAVDTNPHPGLAQLFYMAKLQSSNQLGKDPPDSQGPLPTALVGNPHGADGQATPAPDAKRMALVGSVIVVVALGVLGQAWVGYEGRITGASSPLLWYLTLCLIFTPSAALIMSGKLSDQASVWFTLYMSLALLATRFVLYPDQFVNHDELINYRVLLSIEHSGHLFSPNSLFRPLLTILAWR